MYEIILQVLNIFLLIDAGGGPQVGVVDGG